MKWHDTGLQDDEVYKCKKCNYKLPKKPAVNITNINHHQKNMH